MSNPPQPDRAPAPAPPPACPRCGYDLTGQAATWADACPLAGTCSECGLNFRWSEILSDVNRGPPWLVEHRPRERPSRPRRLWNLYRRCWATVWHLLRPSAFWTAVSLTVPVRVGPLLLWPLILLTCLQPLIAAGNLTNRGRIDLGNRWRSAADPSIGWINALLDPWLFIVPEDNWRRAPFGPVGSVGPPDVRTIFHLAAGADLAVTLAPLLIPLGLLLLSHSRTTARVRPLHVLRAAVYGCFPLVVLLLLLTVRQLEYAARTWLPGVPPLKWNFEPFSVRLFQFAAVPIYLLLAAWVGRYWWCVITRSLQLPRAKLVFALLMLQTLLAALICFVLDRQLHKRFPDLFGA